MQGRAEERETGSPFNSMKEDHTDTTMVLSDEPIGQENPFLNASVNSLASLRNVERRQRRRELNVLVSRLDGMLPKTHRSKAKANGAGGRALGSRGRSLHDVLEDCIDLVRQRVAGRARSQQARGRAKGAGEIPSTQTLASSSSLVGAVMRDGLFSSHSVFCVEVSMPDWRVVGLSDGAQAFFQHAPWGGALGQNFLYAVTHTGDVAALKGMLVELTTKRGAGGQLLGKRARDGAPLGSSITSRIRVLHFFRSFPVEQGEEGSGRFRASEYVSLEVQMIVTSGSASDISVLLLAPFSSAQVVRQGPTSPSQLGRCIPWRPEECALSVPQYRSDLLEAMRAVSGVYEWDASGSIEGAISPGALRAANNGVIGRQGLNFLQRALGAVGGWCMQSLTDFLYQRLQMHFHLSVNDEGVPMVRVHTRLKMAQNFMSRWSFAVSKPQSPHEHHTPVTKQINPYP
jgi:hypothetical protein